VISVRHCCVLILTVLFFAMATPVLPTAAGDSAIVVEGAWARASAGKAKNGAAYFSASIKAGADRLIAVKAEGIAKRAELHGHSMQGGVMRMRPVETIGLTPDKPVTLKPGGFHVMLMGLAAPLVEGATFPMVLTFEKAGAVAVDVTILGVGARGPKSPTGKHGGHGMKKSE